ncbi:MAG TPA: hypothetical protein VEZ41_15380, partial [Allosphingosinicella sp.]|nr:hypothetical protein [Allosphingosinicella sp.]
MARRVRTRAGAASRAWSVPTFPLSIWLLGLLAIAVALLPFLRGPAQVAEGRLDGYSSIVTAAIDRSWLYPVSTQGDGGDVDGRVERVRGGDVPESFDSFIAASFLREDMGTLDPAIWRYDGNRLGIDPRAHLISGAFDGTSGWRGSLLFADSQVEQQLLDERGTPAAWLVASPRPGAAGRPRQLNLMRAPAIEPTAEADAATELTFVATIEGAPTAVASLRRVGPHALLRVPRRDRALVGVAVGSEDVAPRGAFQVGWRLLESGDTLSFAWPGGSRRFQFVLSEPAISRARGDASRVRDPTLASLAQPVENAVGGGAVSLRTSINSRIHGIAQQALVDQSMSLYGSEGITSFRSAAVLMDGMTGEVAAMPSFPVLPEHLHPTQRGSPSHRKMLERNSNFVRLVAGSAAKPPMAMAIVNSFPQLTELRVPATAPFRTLLGIDLGVPVPDQPGGGVWDFRSFLARSSNKYAAMLMLLGLSDAESIRANACEGPTNEPFAIGGQQRNCRPRMDFMEGARPGPAGLRPLRQGAPAGQGWANNLYTLFCVQPNGPDEPPPATEVGCLPNDATRRPIWRDALFERPRLLAAASPDREGFGLNVVDTLYEDYVMTILGGNRGRWTTLGLAQAFSRIVTGRAVTARLTPSQSQPDTEQPEQVKLRIHEGAQARMLDGLKAVVAEGTGRGLLTAGFPAGADGDEFRFFAKTGTPNVSFLGDDARQLLQDFAAAGCGLGLVARSPRQGAPARAELMVGDDPALPAAQAIARRPDCANRFGPSAGRIAELVRALNRSPQALGQVRADATGRVTDVPSQVALGEGTGHLLVLMVGRYRPGTPDAQPCSLRTVAINFQARTSQDRAPAMRYAISLL